VKQSVLNRLSVATAVWLVLCASAQAAPLAMLQFGSFESREEAQVRLDSMKKKHAGMLNKLPTSIREIKLPPDNLTVYRTQAGPVGTRTQAESICAQLASNGDECYVMETSMLPDAPPAVEVDVPAVAEKKAPTPVAAAAAAKPSVPKSAPVIRLIPWRDFSKRDDVKAQMAEKLAEVDTTPAKPSLQLQNAMDQAIARQEKPEASEKFANAEPAPKQERSFWSLLNPFADDESTATASKPSEDATASEMTQTPPELPVMASPVPTVSETAGADMVASTNESTSVAGDVNVEEAKRVPLTETRVAAPRSFALPTADLLPIATLGKKTLWAQVGQFNDTQSALAFWDRYRVAHPDFPVVRIRVISSYQLQQRGDASKWLRVGPFAKEESIANLCASFGENGPRCGLVTDMGVASGVNRTPGLLPESRYRR